MEMNFFAALRATRAAITHMVEQGGGAIVNVASVNAFFQPDAGTIDYGAAKAALVNLSKSLAQEFGPRGIRVNCVSPGPVATELWLGDHGVAATVAQATGVDADTAREAVVASIGGFATGRFTTPEEVATLVALLASERLGNVTGVELRHRRRPHQDDLSLRRRPGDYCRSPTRTGALLGAAATTGSGTGAAAPCSNSRATSARLGSGSSAVAIRVTTPHAAM